MKTQNFTQSLIYQEVVKTISLLDYEANVKKIK